MTRQEIDERIVEIMTNHGPDGHVDGHEALTDFTVECQRDAFVYAMRLQGCHDRDFARAAFEEYLKEEA